MNTCGNLEEHCCWLQGNPCPHVKRVDREDRIWACSLMDEHQDWEKVYNDPRYITDVKPKLEQAGLIARCRDWPDAALAQKCNICGMNK